MEVGESAEQCARREFAEELGAEAPAELAPLPPLKQKGGKWVEAFAAEGEFDPAALVSNRFALEWPPRSGRMETFPEVDRVRWFSLPEAAAMILPSQRPLLEAVEQMLAK